MKANFAAAAVGIVAALALTFGASSCRSHDVEVPAKIVLKDATGRELRLPEAPRRIVTLVPSLAELAADLLQSDQDRIVGVSDFTDYPPALSALPSVGSYDRFNLETVVSLKPDLVLATTDGNPKDRVLRLLEMGVPVLTVATADFRQVAESMELVGAALGFAGRGEEMAEQLKRGVERLRSRAKNRSEPEPSVLLQVGGEPLVIAGGRTFLNEALTAVGARNAYSDLKEAYPRPSMEDVVRKDPDVILVMALGPDSKVYERMASDWRRFARMKAVRSGRVRVLKADALLRPSLRLLEGLSLLERELFPGAAP